MTHTYTNTQTSHTLTHTLGVGSREAGTHTTVHRHSGRLIFVNVHSVDYVVGNNACESKLHTHTATHTHIHRRSLSLTHVCLAILVGTHNNPN